MNNSGAGLPRRPGATALASSYANPETESVLDGQSLLHRLSARSRAGRAACRKGFGVFHQDAFHFLNRFRVALHRMGRVHNLFRCDAVDMRAGILDYAITAIRRRAATLDPRR